MQKQENETPQWLDELQQRSWEPEVLLSGIVLYGMFKVPPVLDRFLLFFKSSIYGTVSDIDNLVGILKLGIYWLIVGLILHLIARGIWVGMVGLSYTFPQGINREKLKFKGRFNTRIDTIPPFQQIIIRLEKLCSSLFSISFMLFMSSLGAYMFLFILVVIPFVFLISFTSPALWSESVIFKIYLIAVLIVGFIALLDFITIGYIRRYKWAGRFYWPVHQVISVLTFARFYRPIYFGFASNYSRKTIVFILILFTTISLYAFGTITDPNETTSSRISLWHTSRGDQAFHGYYDDQNDERFSVQVQIPSDIIDENVLRVFIPVDINKEDSIKAYVNYDSLIAAARENKIPYSKRDLHAVKKFYHIYLNDSLLQNLNWFYHYKSKTGQQGYLAYVNISSLNVGIHHLQVGGPPSMYKQHWADVPFYRDISDSKEESPLYNKQDRTEEYLQVKPTLPK